MTKKAGLVSNGKEDKMPSNDWIRGGPVHTVPCFCVGDCYPDGPCITEEGDQCPACQSKPCYECGEEDGHHESCPFLPNDREAEQTLGSCGCTDYHLADCPIMTRDPYETGMTKEDYLSMPDEYWED